MNSLYINTDGRASINCATNYAFPERAAQKEVEGLHLELP